MTRAVRNFYIRLGSLLGSLLLACALISAGPANGVALAQAGTGTITGQVLSLDNVALPNVHLAVFSQAQGTPNRTKLAEFQSDAQGRYSVQVPAGQVWVEFETQDIRGQSFWGYDNLPVNITAGQTVSGQDFRVAIRLLAGPPAAVPPPAVVPPAVVPPGMPATGVGAPGLLVPLASLLGSMLLLFGLVLRRAPR